MLSSKECAGAWKSVVKCYRETIDSNNPELTMETIINLLGFETTEEVFATVSKIKENDGRIYGENRKYMESVPVNVESTAYGYENQVMYSGLDDIHTAHINNLISELRKLKEERK